MGTMIGFTEGARARGQRLAASKFSRKRSAPAASRSAAASKAGNTPKRSAPAPNASAPLGQGGRFAALKNNLAARPGVTDPAALAASIGRKKYGASKFNALSSGGRS